MTTTIITATTLAGAVGVVAVFAVIAGATLDRRARHHDQARDRGAA
jgi:hypothetical protein